MDNIVAWNVRGLNRPKKQREVANFLLNHKGGLVGILENKIKPKGFANMYMNMFQGWCISSNIKSHKGGRIIVVWIDSHFTVDIIIISPQLIHLREKNFTHKMEFFCTFVYAFNDATERKQLWNELRAIYETIQGPWIRFERL